MDRSDLANLIGPMTEVIVAHPLDAMLADELNKLFPPDGAGFKAIEAACHEAIAAGWMCAEGGAGRRFGRVMEPSPATRGLSVDVVNIANFRGPHHRHPTGEVCMVMPLSETARFCGHGRGWCVFEPGSDHHPEVTGGEALVLYMLPEGRIEFTE